jgi:hypothetical protein
VPVADLRRFCDPGSRKVCRRLEGFAVRTACIEPCTRAEECMPGWACTAIEGTEVRICAPQCRSDADCTARGRCVNRAAGPCAASDAECFCR